jgi:chromosome condensin MukBEF complex kleisin-like MukF subunit
MAKKTPQRSFNDVLALLGGQRFDVAPAQEGAKRTPNAVQVRKYGCAAEIAAALDGTVEVLARPGWLLNGEIARLLDRGYQKFIKTSKLEIPATADHLRAIHEFSEELGDAIGATSLYNQSLGTTSNVYHYDRVKGRDE